MENIKDTAFSIDTSSIKFGSGVSEEVGWELSRLGCKNVMIVTDNNLTEHQSVRTIIKSLDKNNIKKNPNVIAVSKTFGMDKIEPLIKYGHIHFGENKVQEAVEKWTDIKNDFNKFLSSKKMIGVYPVGKSFFFEGRFFSSWNDLAGSVGKGPKGDICDIDRDYYPYPPDCKNPHRCSWASCDDDLGFIEKVIDHHKGKYDIKKDQSYSKVGYYLNEHWNIGMAYVMENCAKYKSEYF